MGLREFSARYEPGDVGVASAHLCRAIWRPCQSADDGRHGMPPSSLFGCQWIWADEGCLLSAQHPGVLLRPPGNARRPAIATGPLIGLCVKGS